MGLLHDQGRVDPVECVQALLEGRGCMIVVVAQFDRESCFLGLQIAQILEGPEHLVDDGCTGVERLHVLFQDSD